MELSEMVASAGVAMVLFAVATIIVVLIAKPTPNPEDIKAPKSSKSNFCFVSEKDLAAYRKTPKWGIPRTCDIPLREQSNFISSTSPQFQSRGIPFPEMQYLNPKEGYQYEYLYS